MWRGSMDDKVAALVNELMERLKALDYPVKVSNIHVAGEEPFAAIFLHGHRLDKAHKLKARQE